MDKLLTNVDWNQMLAATGETLYMTAIAALATFVLGLILGLLLFMTAKDNLWENKAVNTAIGAFVNIFRSIPFIILIILFSSCLYHFTFQKQSFTTSFFPAAHY